MFWVVYKEKEIELNHKNPDAIEIQRKACYDQVNRYT